MRDTFPRQGPESGHDRGDLGIGRREPAHLGGRAAGQGGHEPFRWSRRIARLALVESRPTGLEDSIGEAEDLGRRAVVALEADEPGRRVSLVEPEEVVARRPSERVDRLVLVADDPDVLAAAKPRVEERLLQRVRVLVLVDREPAISITDFIGDGGVRLDQPDRQFEHVLEVDPPGAPLGDFVAAIQTGHEVGGEGSVAADRDGAVLVGRGVDPTRLRPLDLGCEVADRQVPISAGQVRGEWREDRRLRGKDLGRLGPVDARPEMAQLPKSSGMEGSRRHAPVAEVRQPTGHRAGGLLGERDDEDVTRPDDACREGPCDASGDHPGLARTGARKDAHRTGRDRHGRALVGIEVGEERVAVPPRSSGPIVAGRAAPAITRLSSGRWNCAAASSRSARPSRKMGQPLPRSSRSPRSRPGGAAGTWNVSTAHLLGPDPEEEPFAIEHDGVVVGYIQVYEEDEPDFRHAALDLFITTNSQGRGFGPDAITTLATHLIDDRGHHRLSIDPAAANARAIAAYAKVGFRPVGIMRRYQRLADGTWVDALLMDLLADELVR